jgi:cation diffusion facilitator CzcD-associated flavoprotein CzcO
MNYTEAVVQKFERLRARLAAVEAERDAAQAGEARAVEALRAVVAAVLPHEEDTWTMKGSALRHVHRVLDQYEPTPDNQPSALDWLARQRAEAVAAWIEKQVAENLERYGTHYYERTTDDLMREAAAFRAAALRAGEVDND